MKREDKELMLKDLCGRLPYGVKASTKVGGNIEISFIGEDTIIGEDGDSYDVSFITPYLFPMSSMTEEQYENFIIVSGFGGEIEDVRRGRFVFLGTIGIDFIYDTLDWLNANHFDYRGLIGKGLAIDCTNLNIY